MISRWHSTALVPGFPAVVALSLVSPKKGRLHHGGPDLGLEVFVLLEAQLRTYRPARMAIGRDRPGHRVDHFLRVVLLSR